MDFVEKETDRWLEYTSCDRSEEKEEEFNMDMLGVFDETEMD